MGGAAGAANRRGDARRRARADPGSAPDLSVAGRTDAGVHAWGQVASFAHAGELRAGAACTLAERGATGRRRGERRPSRRRTLRRSPRRPLADLLLPRAARGQRPARSSASARCGGRTRWTRRRSPLCAALLRGTHDFTAFTPTRTDHVRFERDVLDARWAQRRGTCSSSGSRQTPSCGTWCACWSGTMLDVAGGRGSPESFEALLRGEPRSAAGRTVDPHGLYLAAVRY